MKFKKLVVAVLATSMLLSTLAISASAQDLGGWSETKGNFVYEDVIRTRGSEPEEHGGRKMDRVVSNQTQLQAYGWTIWKDVRHYTTAQMESYGGTVLKTSGRKWGTSETEAYSGWWDWKPDMQPIACTYWGN